MVLFKVLAMVAGGTNPNTGVEIWNPNDGTVTLAFDLLPPETASVALLRGYLHPIKGTKLKYQPCPTLKNAR